MSSSIMLGFLYSLASVVIPLLHAREQARVARVSMWNALRKTSIVPLVVGIIVMLCTFYAAAKYPHYVHQILHWQLNTLFKHWRWQSLAS